MTAGILVFDTLQAAINAGFSMYDKTPEGYLVKRKGPSGWELAIVVIKKGWN